MVPVNKAECLHAHNALRSLHVDTGPVAWSDALTHDAQIWAEHIASIGGLPHSNNKEQGENIYWFSATGTCADAALPWYNEYKYYDYATTYNTTNKPIGHFTQVVWKSTTTIGVGMARSASGTYIVARYHPRGNYVLVQIGENYEDARLRVFSDNVRPRKHGAVTPTIYELVPSRCVNGLNGQCSLYQQYFTCNHSYVKAHCPKLCKVC
ncbi:Golgi-associated plant pathogenesis-related protein 1-like [Hydractinia symbiolongicarpus]|uniref:Golgi-associated plant pathogenesis-related protein 1-like n=1 Tax=Hydractinia symbiolongicarpus TaxID=13093 RepID=UPI00254C1A0B|nr:Golgi-associated plant pathogenesis-related protein 1-like [Hydractinia symbiolongicarpus]